MKIRFSVLPMEERLILYQNKKVNGKSLLEARKLEYRKMNCSFLFSLDDGQYFFISYYFCDNFMENRKDRVIVRPNNHIFNKILRHADDSSFSGYLIINISGGDCIPVMHLLDAILIVLKDLKIGMRYTFEAFNIKIIKNENLKKIVLDTDIETDNQILLVKAGKSDIFILESVGEIEPDCLCDIVESCFA